MCEARTRLVCHLRVQTIRRQARYTHPLPRLILQLLLSTHQLHRLEQGVVVQEQVVPSTRQLLPSIPRRRRSIRLHPLSTLRRRRNTRPLLLSTPRRLRSTRPLLRSTLQRRRNIRQRRHSTLQRRRSTLQRLRNTRRRRHSIHRLHRNTHQLLHNTHPLRRSIRPLAVGLPVPLRLVAVV